MALPALLLLIIVKGTVHSKLNILSSFIHATLVPNLAEFISSVQPKRKEDLLKKAGKL